MVAEAGVSPLVCSVAEAAELLGVSQSHLYELLRTRQLPGFRVGGRWVISRRLLEEWVEARCLANWQRSGAAD